MATDRTTYRYGTTQVKAYTGTAGVIDNAVGGQTRAVRLLVTTTAHVNVSISASATTADVPFAPWTAEIVTINPGEKVSAIQLTAGGNLHVTELS